MFKFAISAFVLTITLVMGAGCQNSSRQDSPKEGSSSGGGGFGDESSLTILHWAADDLATQIEHSSPEIYAKLPAGWTQARLAKVIREVKPGKDGKDRAPEVVRYGLRLMFADVQEGGYITATQLFLDAYSSFEVNSRSKASFYATIEEVKLRLAHEVAHLMGLGNTKETDMPQAREFAKSLLVALDRDNLECLSAKAPKEAYSDSQSLQTALEGDAPPTTSLAYVINRPSGRGMALTNAEPDAKDGVVITESGKRFDFSEVERRISKGEVAFGSEDGTFGWNSVDLRQAVQTDDGYRSEYAYSEGRIDTHLDFNVVSSGANALILETQPPGQRESPSFKGSKGTLKLEFKNAGDAGEVDATGTMAIPFNHVYEENKSASEPVTLELVCRRTFRALN